MRRSKLVPLMLALVLVAASGCLGAGTDDPTNSDSAITSGMDDSAVREAVVSSSEEVERYAMTMNQTYSGGGFNSSTTYQGVIDRESRRARLNITSEGNGETQRMATIVDEPAIYSKQETGTNWTKRNSESFEWRTIDRLSVLVELLEQSNATAVGSTTVDGSGATVLEADVEQETLAEVASGGNESTAGQAEPNVTMSLRAVVDNATARPQTITLHTVRSSEFGSSESTLTVTIDTYGVETQIGTPQETVTATVRTGSDGATTTVVTASAPPTEEG